MQSKSCVRLKKLKDCCEQEHKRHPKNYEYDNKIKPNLESKKDKNNVELEMMMKQLHDHTRTAR